VSRVAFVLNQPTPYRNPVFRLMVKRNRSIYRFMYCTQAEPNRSWTVSNEGLDVLFLGRNYLIRFSGYIHANLDVWQELSKFNPAVVVTGGYSPTYLLAVFYCLVKRVRHISSTDGDVEFERGLSPLHKVVRRLVRLCTSAYVGPSDSSLELFQTWGATSAQVFKSPLCADNDALATADKTTKKYDFIVCGMLIDHKKPLFALEVVAGVAKILGRRVSVAFLGDGPQQQMIEQRADSLDGVEVTMAGFIQPEGTPEWFGQSRILLFPSQRDAWGLVVNEAFAAGVAVITSPFSGAARELVEDGVSGLILPLEIEVWVTEAAALLADGRRLTEMGRLGQARVEDYSYSHAVAGYENAIAHALGDSPQPLARWLPRRRRQSLPRTPSARSRTADLNRD
jgi:glycosyltransferase involved in cell wall biosynthesis